MENEMRLALRPQGLSSARRLVLAAAASASIYIGVGGAANAQANLTVLYSFTGGAGGGNPVGDLLVDATGPGGTARAIYSADPFNGAGGCQYGCGLDFQLTPPKSGSGPWTYTELYGFTGGAMGSNPYSPLFVDAKKIKASTPLYGTTSGFFGGNGNGTVYSLVGNVLTTLYSFTGGKDGGGPGAGVVADKAGDLYTTAEEGGGSSNCGTVIKLTPPAKGKTAWTESTIWAFSGTSDGCSPNGVIIDENGVLYGTASEGGPSNDGTAFALTPPAEGQTAWTEQTLVSFVGTNGANPYAGLSFGKGGLLYGTAYYGGPNNGGVVFQLKPPKKAGLPWRATVLWNFSGGTDSEGPDGVLLVDKNGNLFGTTNEGPTGAGGTIFRLSPPSHDRATWTQTTLWDFTGGSDGGNPAGGLVADKAGTLYGTTLQGPMNGCAFGYGCGVVFSLTGTGFAP